MGFVGSHLWEIRQRGWGDKKILYPGVFMLVKNKQGNFLVGKRTDMDKWGSVSGHMELNESVEDAARRELLEETGLVASSLVPFGMMSHPIYSSTRYPNGHEVQHVTMLFLVETEKGIPHNGDGEHSEWRYVSLDEMATMAGETTAKNIELFKRFETTKQFQLS